LIIRFDFLVFRQVIQIKKKRIALALPDRDTLVKIRWAVGRQGNLNRLRWQDLTRQLESGSGAAPPAQGIDPVHVSIRSQGKPIDISRTAAKADIMDLNLI